MMRKIVLLTLSLFSFSSCFAAISSGKVDQLDPIYETSALPNNYYVQDKSKNSMVFANERVPNMYLTVKFLPTNGKPMYELIADYMFSTVHNDIVNKCQSASFYKNFASIEFECVRNQDSLLQVIVTQFEDQNNQPSDFFRVATVSYKTGDSPTTDEIGEMINFANFNLGFFEKLNIPQKTILNHHTDPDFGNIDIAQMEELVKENDNLWSKEAFISPTIIDSQEITDKGMKFLMKTKDTNEKFIASMVLSSLSSEDLSNELLSAIPSYYHNCRDAKKTVGVEFSSINAKCDEGNILVNIRQLHLKKYEFSIYEVISGNAELVNRIIADPVLSKNLSSYLYKTFYDLEMLHKKNNVFDYMANVDAGLIQSAPLSFIIDNSTAKSVARGPVNKNSQAKQEDENKKTLIQMENSTDDGDYLYTVLADVARIGALVVLLILFGKRRKLNEEAKAEKERIKAEKAKKKAEEYAKKASDANEVELLAEIAAAQIEREKQQKKLYQQKRDAEQLAKQLEERLEQGGEEEINRRKAALDKFATNSDKISSIAVAITQPKVEASDSVANKEARQQIKNNNSDEALLAKDTSKDQSTESTHKAAEKTTDKKSDKVYSEENVKSTAAKDPKDPKDPKDDKEDNSKSQVKSKKIWTNNSGAGSVMTEEESKKAKDEEERKAEEEERKAEEERKRKAEEFKFKGDSLLMKMKQDRSKNQVSAPTPEKKEEPIVVDTKPSVKFNLVGDKSEQKDKAQEKPVVKTPTDKAVDQGVKTVEGTAKNTSIFNSDDMVMPSSDEKVEKTTDVKPAINQKSKEVKKEEVPKFNQQTTFKNSIFGDDDMVVASSELTEPKKEESSIVDKENTKEDKDSDVKKKRANNPFDALVVNKRSDKYEDNSEVEIDLEGQLNEEIDLNLFANNKDEPSSESETILDLTPSDESVLDLTSVANSSISNESFMNEIESNSLETGLIERKNFFGSSDEDVATTNSVVDEPKEAPSKKRISKKIRKFNLNSLSTPAKDE